MKGALILFALFATTTVCSSSHNGELPGLITTLDRIIQGFGACAFYCLARRMKEVQSSFEQTCLPAMNKTIFEPVKGLPYEAIYSRVFIRLSEGNTQMCAWAHTAVEACAFRQLDTCTTEVRDAYKTIEQEVLDYVCSTEPPILECAMSPDLISKAQELGSCTQPFVEQFGRHFSSNSPGNLLEEFDNLYNVDVKPNNGELLYSEIKSLVRCMTSKVEMFGNTASGESCDSARSVMNKEVDGILEYLKKTDIILCGLNPELWQRMKICGENLMQDAEGDPLFAPSAGQDTEQPFMSALLEGEYYKFQGLWEKLQTCIETEVREVCGEKWVYKRLEMILQAGNALIYADDAPDYCNDLTGGSGNDATGGSGVLRASKMAVVSMILFVKGAAFFL